MQVLSPGLRLSLQRAFHPELLVDVDADVGYTATAAAVRSSQSRWRASTASADSPTHCR